MTDATATPAWRPDPTGRHAQRWFDGTNWTEHVADAQGVTSIDPLPPEGAPQQPEGSAPVDPTRVSPEGAQSDATATYAAPGWGAAQPPPEQAPGWGAPQPPPEQAPGWGAPQPPPEQAPGWGAAPQGAQPAPGWAAPQPAYGAGPYGAPVAYGAPTRTAFNPVGLVVVGVGAVLVLVSLFALNWVSPGDGKLTDIHKAIKNVDDITFLTKNFPSWGAYVALVLGIGSALAGVFVKSFKVVAAGVGILMAAWCLFFGFDLVHWYDKDIKPIQGGHLTVQVGAWLAAAGFVAAAIGAILPSRRT